MLSSIDTVLIYAYVFIVNWTRINTYKRTHKALMRGRNYIGEFSQKGNLKTENEHQLYN
jgi:hypothetical protein